MSDHRSLVRTPLLKESPLDQYRGVTDERRLRHQHAVLISEGDSDESPGFALVFGPLEASEFFKLAGEFFGRQSFEIIIESETGTIIEKHLVMEGWTCTEEEVAMVLTPIPTSLQPASSLEIVPVTTHRAYEDYMSVTPANRDWVPNLEAATDPMVGLFTGYAGGAPVATSRFTCYGRVAEITGVQTLPDHRRQGYGRAMTWAAVAEAKRRGCRHIMLTATEMGYPLYLKMGFQKVCSYRVYQPPAISQPD